MAKNRNGSSADHSKVLAKVGGARIKILHERLIADTDGKLSEVPELLVAVEMLRGAVKKYSGTAFNVSTQPYIQVGEYGILISLAQTSQSDNKISDRYHALPESLHYSYAKIIKNAESERPFSLRTLKIPHRDMPILKALGKLHKLQVITTLTTDDGQVSQFPRVESKYLNESKADIFESKKIEKQIAGIDLGSHKEVLVRFYKSHWICIQFATYSQTCLKLAAGVKVNGLLEVIDGVWTIRDGRFVDPVTPGELEFEPT